MIKGEGLSSWVIESEQKWEYNSLEFLDARIKKKKEFVDVVKLRF